LPAARADDDGMVIFQVLGSAPLRCTRMAATSWCRRYAPWYTPGPHAVPPPPNGRPYLRCPAFYPPCWRTAPRGWRRRGGSPDERHRIRRDEFGGIKAVAQHFHVDQQRRNVVDLATQVTHIHRPSRAPTTPRQPARPAPKTFSLLLRVRAVGDEAVDLGEGSPYFASRARLSSGSSQRGDSEEAVDV
jgi:hypothetical protein